MSNYGNMDLNKKIAQAYKKSSYENPIKEIKKSPIKTKEVTKEITSKKHKTLDDVLLDLVKRNTKKPTAYLTQEHIEKKGLKLLYKMYKKEGKKKKSKMEFTEKEWVQVLLDNKLVRNYDEGKHIIDKFEEGVTCKNRFYYIRYSHPSVGKKVTFYYKKVW